jgi:hypothetical protein
VTVAADVPRSRKKPQLPAKVVAGWRKAGAEIGWMTPDGEYRSDYQPGAIPAFKFFRKPRETWDKLPVVGQPFGLVMPESDTRDTDLKGVSALKQLHILDLTGFKEIGIGVTDRGLKELASLRQLRMLSLAYTPVTDSGLKALISLKQLRTLDLSGTKVTDKGLKTLASLKHLRELSLHGTEVTDAGVKQLRKVLPRLRISI